MCTWQVVMQEPASPVHHLFTNAGNVLTHFSSVINLLEFLFCYHQAVIIMSRFFHYFSGAYKSITLHPTLMLPDPIQETTSTYKLVSSTSRSVEIFLTY